MNKNCRQNKLTILETLDLHKEFEISKGILYQILRGKPPVNIAVDGVSLSVCQGETLALVGESGCGKTTLGRMICMLEKPTRGSIFLDGEDVGEADEKRIRQLRSKMQMIFQNPYDSLDPRQRVSSLVEQPLILQKTGNPSHRYEKAMEYINAVGLHPAETFMNRYPHELSGGQRQRVAIARAMIVEPKVIVADEPVSMLDVSIRSGILNMMMDIRSQLGSSFLFITHDLSVGHYVSDRIAVMYIGNVVEMGPTQMVVDRPIHPYTRLLLAAVPRLPWGEGRKASSRRKRVQLIGEVFEKPSSELEGCKFAPRCPLARAVCYRERPPLEQYEANRYVACIFRKESEALSNDSMLAIAARMLKEQKESRKDVNDLSC